MKRLSSLAVQAPSLPGVLGKIYRAFESDGVAIHAILAPDAMHSGIIQIIPGSVDRGREILDNLTYPYTVEEILVLDLPDGDRDVGDLITTLAIARINIDFLFTLDRKRVALSTSDMDRTLAVLSENFPPASP